MAPMAECPVCREPLRWTYVLRPLWSQWRSGRCGSLLVALPQLVTVGLGIACWRVCRVRLARQPAVTRGATF